MSELLTTARGRGPRGLRAAAPPPSPPPPPPPVVGPLTLSLAAATLAVGQGETELLYVRVTRPTGAVGPVVIELPSLPSGLASGPITIPADSSAGVLTVSASAQAALATYTRQVRATLDGLAPVTVSLQLQVVAPGTSAFAPLWANPLPEAEWYDPALPAVTKQVPVPTAWTTAQLQAALNAEAATLQNGQHVQFVFERFETSGHTYVFNTIYLPARTDTTGWISFAAAGYGTPAGLNKGRGQRAVPSDAPKCARLLHTGTERWFAADTRPWTSGRSNRYCWLGLNYYFGDTPQPGVWSATYFMPDQAPTLADLPDEWVIRHNLWTHGAGWTVAAMQAVMHSQQNQVAAHGKRLSLTDSWFHLWTGRGGDQGCIGGSTGVGPVFVDNCYLGGAGINVMFGGGGVLDTGETYTAIVIARCFFEKPEFEDGSTIGKNLLEIKHGCGWVIVRCVFKKNTDISFGAVSFKSHQQDVLGAPTVKANNIYMADCHIRDAMTGLLFSAAETYSNGGLPGSAEALHSIDIVNCLVQARGDAFRIGGHANHVTQGVSGVMVGHPRRVRVAFTTFVAPNAGSAYDARTTSTSVSLMALTFSAFGPTGTPELPTTTEPWEGVVFDSCVFDSAYGHRNGGGWDAPYTDANGGVLWRASNWRPIRCGHVNALPGFWDGYEYTWVTPAAGGWTQQVGLQPSLWISRDTPTYVNPSAGDYTIVAGHPWKGRGTGGRDIGVDMPRLLARTAHCESGQWL